MKSRLQEHYRLDYWCQLQQALNISCSGAVLLKPAAAAVAVLGAVGARVAFVAAAVVALGASFVFVVGFHVALGVAGVVLLASFVAAAGVVVLERAAECAIVQAGGGANVAGARVHAAAVAA